MKLCGSKKSKTSTSKAPAKKEPAKTVVTESVKDQEKIKVPVVSSKPVETNNQYNLNNGYANGIIIFPQYNHSQLKETVQVTTKPAPPPPAPVVEKQTIIERPVYNEHPPVIKIKNIL